MNFSQIKNLNSTQKIIYLISIFLIFSLLLFYFLVMPTMAKITKLKNNILYQKIDLENKVTREKNINILNEKIKKIDPELTKFDQIYINQNLDLEFITTLEGIATKNQIIQKINFDPTTAVTEMDYKKIAISFNLAGSYINFLKYLDDLQTLPYYININQIDISPGLSPEFSQMNNDAYKSDGITVKMSANTYWK